MKKVILIVAACFFVASCSQSSQEKSVSNDASAANSMEGSSNADAPIVAQDASPPKSSKDYPVSFDLVYRQATDIIQPLPAIPLGNESIEVTSMPIGNDRIAVYRMKEDTDSTYAFIKSNGKIYDLGLIGYSSLLEGSDYEMKRVRLFSQDFIKLNGSCGANCPISDYANVHVTPALYLHFEAHTAELDVDGDGQEEIVATQGTAAQTSIYKWQDGAISAVSVNETMMNAKVVLYDADKKLFTAQMQNDEVADWKLSGNRIIKVIN